MICISVVGVDGSVMPLLCSILPPRKRVPASGYHCSLNNPLNIWMLVGRHNGRFRRLPIPPDDGSFDVAILPMVAVIIPVVRDPLMAMMSHRRGRR